MPFESGYFVRLSTKTLISALPSLYASLYSHVECYLRFIWMSTSLSWSSNRDGSDLCFRLLAGVSPEICLHLVPAMSPYLIVLEFPSPPQPSLFLPFCVFFLSVS